MQARWQAISSRENAAVKHWRKLAQDNHAYRKQGQLWLEGEHLCEVALARRAPIAAVVAGQSLLDSGRAQQWLEKARQTSAVPIGQAVVVPDALFADISPMGSPAQLAFVSPLPVHDGLDLHAPTVVLDRLQDAGNVGAILRAAAAFGFRQIAALKGTAGLWSPKVLRAGMGAHWSLRLLELQDIADVQQLQLPLLLTSSHKGEYLHAQKLPWPCAWVFGHEGQGVSAALERLPHTAVRIAQPGGQESLNVASAAAICLYASAAAAFQSGSMAHA